MTTALSFDWVTTESGLEQLRDAWDRVAPAQHVFGTWEWQATWWQRLGRPHAGPDALRILVARDGEGVRAILPLYVRSRAARRELRLLGDGIVGSEYLGLVASADDQRRLSPLVAKHLGRDPLLGDIDRVRLGDVADGDLLVPPLFRELRQELGYVALRQRYHCATARLSPAFDDYAARRPGALRAQLARRLHWLEQRPGFAVTIAESPHDVAQGMEALLSLHHARWAAAGGSQAIPDEAVADFHRQSALRLAERGWVRLVTLSIEGAPVAATYGFLRGSTCSFYQSGYDPAWRARSVGTIGLGLLVRRACEEGATELDLLRGKEEYKSQWADSWRSTHELVADRDDWVARAVRGAETVGTLTRGAIGRALPAALRGPLRAQVNHPLG